jgi:hypothetical protein
LKVKNVADVADVATARKERNQKGRIWPPPLPMLGSIDRANGDGRPNSGINPGRVIFVIFATYRIPGIARTSNGWTGRFFFCGSGSTTSCSKKVQVTVSMCRVYAVTLGVVGTLCLVVVILIGSTGSRYESYRLVTFVDYANCPARIDKWGKTKPSLSSSQCVNVQDPMGYSSVAFLEEASPRPGSPSSPLYINGLLATVDNPRDVMLGSAYTISVIAALYFGVAFVHLCLRPDVHLGLEANKAPKTTTLYSAGLWFYGLMLVLVGVGFIVALCVYAGFSTQWREITCNSYVRCNDEYPDVGCVMTSDATTKDFKRTLLGSTRQPSVLPAPCWTDGDDAEFYGPNELLQYFSIVSGASFAFFFILLIAHWAIFTEREQAFARNSQQIAPISVA